MCFGRMDPQNSQSIHSEIKAYQGPRDWTRKNRSWKILGDQGDLFTYCCRSTITWIHRMQGDGVPTNFELLFCSSKHFQTLNQSTKDGRWLLYLKLSTFSPSCKIRPVWLDHGKTKLCLFGLTWRVVFCWLLEQRPPLHNWIPTSPCSPKPACNGNARW